MEKNSIKKNSYILFFLTFILFAFVFSRIIYANTFDPGQMYSNCNQCGLCQFNLTPLPTPQSYEACKKCLYPNTENDADTLKIDKNTKLPPAPEAGKMYTMLGCIGTDAGEFTQQLVGYFMRIVGGIAFLFLLYGAAIVASSRANPERLNYGKRVIIASIAGLIIVLGATFIIRLIASNILQIPGFGG